MSRPVIESPCIKVCAVDGRNGLCLGCGRTLREIGGWIQMGEAARKDVMADLPRRMRALDAGLPVNAGS